jgi:NAD(P)-dependent dehydrogenase (short-subunit alcohol dehydrogenase family)
MCNNAGIAIEPKLPRLLGIWETPDEQFDKTIQVNLRGVFLGCKHAGAQMIKQEPHESGDRGWIINTASILGLVGCYGTSSYSAAKGGVVNLTRTAALDFATYRIHCNAICPGCELIFRCLVESTNSEKRYRYRNDREFFEGIPGKNIVNAAIQGTGKSR